MQTLNFTKPNAAWILHREDFDIIQDGSCNVYVLFDAYSEFIFGQEISIDLPSPSKIIDLLKSAHSKSNTWPQQILILKKDPYVENFQIICKDLNIPLKELTANEIKPLVQEFRNDFRQFKMNLSLSDEPMPLSEAQKENLDAFIPETYSPCPCASGKKFKFCCQKAFRDIGRAMCEAQDGRLDEALRFMKQAEEKVGRTAEIVCRIAICWSYFDQNKFQFFLKEAIELNPKHPRVNYVLGIEAVAKKEYEKAIEYYKTAIESYPNEDKFHLNETYNNMGTAYYELKRYKEAKETWEKALVLLPSDLMVKENLFDCIYNNPFIPSDLRVISPFIKKHLNR